MHAVTNRIDAHIEALSGHDMTLRRYYRKLEYGARHGIRAVYLGLSARRARTGLFDAAAFGYDFIELWGGRPHAYAPDLLSGGLAESCGG